MGRYQVSITKVRDEIHSEQNVHRLHVEVTDLEALSRPQRRYGNAADFNILEPGVRLVRIEALKNYPSVDSRKASPAESVNPVENAQENDKNQLYRTQLITYSQGKTVDKKYAPLWPTGKDCSDLDLRGDQSFLEVNAENLPTNKRISHIVIVDKANAMGSRIFLKEVTDIDGNIKEEVIAVEKKKSVTEEDLTANVIHEIPTTSLDSEPEAVAPRIDKPELVEETTANESEGHENITEIISAIRNSSTNSVIVIAVGDILVIRIELETDSPEVKDALNNNPDTTTIAQLSEPDADVSLSPANIRETFFEPQENIGFATGLQTSLLAGDYLQGRTIEDEKKKLEQRAIQKDLLSKLIFERLLMLKVSYDDAHIITSAWNNGYIQHRPFSYRITKGEYQKPEVENSLGSNIIESQKFASDFLHHGKVLEGILDSATCTVIESTFFLMLPHFNLQPEEGESANVRLIGAVNSQNFMQDWAQVIFTAAYQLKPIKPVSVESLILKEVKLLGKPLHAIQKVARKLKHKSNDLQFKIEKLQRKLLKRIEPQAEFMAEVLQKKYTGRVSIEQDCGRLQLPPNLSAENLFQNSMHLAIGNRGLLIKQKAGDKWFSFSDLNFSERRVIFLGMTDHMFSSFDAVLRTLRHLLELYTPGYPNNIVARITALFEDLKNENLPFMRIDPQTRMMIYRQIYALGNAINRFENVLFQLVKMTKDVKKEIGRTKYRPSEAKEFIQNVVKERPKAHLVVPFATLRVDGLADLKLRAFEFEEPYPEGEGQYGHGQDDKKEEGQGAYEQKDKKEELKDNFNEINQWSSEIQN